MSQLVAVESPGDDGEFVIVKKENNDKKTRKISALELKNYFNGNKISKSTSTPSTILANSSANLTVPSVAKTYLLTQITTNVPARVILYLDESSRINDSSRVEGISPTPNSGVMAEVVTTSGGLSKIFTPAVSGWSLDGDIYVKLTNKNTSSSIVTVTLTYLILEI